jgi:hypothetical protein
MMRLIGIFHQALVSLNPILGIRIASIYDCSSARGADMMIFDQLSRLYKAKPAAEPKPSYYLGDKWTPSLDQIGDARLRQKARREYPATRWRRPGAEFEAARAAIICAMDRSKDDETSRQLRPIRSLVFDSDAEIFVRNLRVSTDRYLIEFRHPRLTSSDGRTPVGLRFIGLSTKAWKKKDRDPVGIYLDGTISPIKDLFAANFEKTIKSSDLVEGYARFAFNHINPAGGQSYLISSLDEFVLDEEEAGSGAGIPPADVLFRAPAPPGSTVGVDAREDLLLRALRLQNDALVPPTFIRLEPENRAGPRAAVVFVTVIHQLQLRHLCVKISGDGSIVSVAGPTQSAENTVLPLVPIHSFDEQMAAIKRAFP